jgi:hypothetical protein
MTRRMTRMPTKPEFQRMYLGFESPIAHKKFARETVRFFVLSQISAVLGLHFSHIVIKICVI